MKKLLLTLSLFAVVQEQKIHAIVPDIVCFAVIMTTSILIANASGHGPVIRRIPPQQPEKIVPATPQNISNTMAEKAPNSMHEEAPKKKYRNRVCLYFLGIDENGKPS